jgi:hypothetical protein
MMSSGDASRLRLGLVAATILQEREDYRDIVVSLAFLHHAARRAGIDPDPSFREVAALARPETEEFMRAFLERGEVDIEKLVETFSRFTGTGLRARSRSSGRHSDARKPGPLVFFPSLARIYKV